MDTRRLAAGAAQQVLRGSSEQLLCRGRARIDGTLMLEAQLRLSPYIEAGLCGFANGELTISSQALPYARSIAAAFDPYRQHSPRRFSSAV